MGQPTVIALTCTNFNNNTHLTESTMRPGLSARCLQLCPVTNAAPSSNNSTHFQSSKQSRHRLTSYPPCHLQLLAVPLLRLLILMLCTTQLALAGIVWQDDFTQVDKYCRTDHDISHGTPDELSVALQIAAGYQRGLTLSQCKKWCEDKEAAANAHCSGSKPCVVTGCRGISYKSASPTTPCVLVTRSVQPCSTSHTGWSTYWHRQDPLYKNIMNCSTLVYGTLVNTISNDCTFSPT